jgi:hypothetical protein
MVKDVRFDERERLRIDGHRADSAFGLRCAVADVDEATLDVEILTPLDAPRVSSGSLGQPELRRESAS